MILLHLGKKFRRWFKADVFLETFQIFFIVDIAVKITIDQERLQIDLKG